jgi:hypothetical protein
VPADQFNHAVASVREQDGSLRLLDPTWMPKSRDDWSTSAPLQHVVYGVPEGMELARSPYFPPETSTHSWKAESELGGDGQLSSRLVLTATGAPETSLRRTLAGRPPAQRERIYQDAFARISPVALLTGLRATDPVDFSRPLMIEAAVSAERYALGDGERRVLALPALRAALGDVISDITGGASLETRKHPLRLSATRRVLFEETIRLPQGWTVEHLPDMQALDGPVAALRFEAEKTDHQLSYVCELTIKQRRIPPADYANYKQVVDAFNKLADAVIVCKWEPTSAQR